MKICKSCKQEKPADSFYLKHDGTSYRHSSCKECYNALVMLKAQAKKVLAIDRFGDVCHDCGQSFHHVLYDFHHLDPSKKDISWNKLRYKSMKTIWLELDKCVMLCSHCHRMRHYGDAPLISVGAAEALVSKQRTRKRKKAGESWIAMKSNWSALPVSSRSSP